MTTPIEFAERIAKGSYEDRVLAVAIFARGLSDEDPVTGRQPWPVPISITAAIRHLGITPEPGFVDDVTLKMPTIPDYVMNKGAAR